MSSTGAIGSFVIGVSPIGGAGSIGSATFNPPVADILIELFERCGVHSQLTTEQIISGRRSLNLTASRWSNKGRNLWKSTLVSSALLQGLEAYAVPEETIDIFNAYRRVTVGGVNTDTFMSPISQAEYAMLPQKSQQGVPTAYYFAKMPASGSMVLYVWPTPDANGPYTLFYYAQFRMADTNIENSAVLDVRHPLYESFCADCAAHLAVKWADPQRAVALNALAKEIWEEAKAADTEHVPLQVSPDLSAYF